VGELGVGSLVDVKLSIRRHPAIVLSTAEEIAESGMVLIVAISSNTTISLPEDRIAVPSRGLGMKKKCFEQCGVVERVSENQVKPLGKKAYGPFLETVLKQVQVARDRAKKSTQS
jgi:hypothetical protein